MQDGFRRRRRSERASAPKRGDGLEPILAEIDGLIGLEPVKQEIFRLVDFARVVSLKKDRDLPVANLTFHMVFTGPPGTGKTTVARYIGRLLYELKLLRKEKLIEVDRSALVGTHLGDTARLVQDKVKDALDGVLFIDEAYTLAGGGGATGKTDPFGQEAIDTLLKLMEDHRERLVCIFAGYTTEMRRFVEANPGLKSRISRTVEFPSYDGDELYQIFESLVTKNGFNMTDEAADEARKVIDDLARNADENFGNAREVRQFFEALQPIQAERIAEHLDEVDSIDQIDNETLMRIEEDDITYYAEHI
ncbi:AAA family ATPase [uncultured Roseobacter sp.]|uniref:AAA family ATPase n=1 Tax=uncultured Roseobacter sp. TaxID=114847 RepID=UPI0026282BE1|nr:AAA family ATPase [uncultured Roseobacter sp.]